MSHLRALGVWQILSRLNASTACAVMKEVELEHVISFFGDTERSTGCWTYDIKKVQDQVRELTTILSEVSSCRQRARRNFQVRAAQQFQVKYRTFGFAGHFLTLHWEGFTWNITLKQAQLTQQSLPDHVMDYFSLCSLEIRLWNASDSLASYPNAWHLGSVQNSFNIVVTCSALWEMWAGVCTVKANETEAIHTLFTYMLKELHCSIPVVPCMPKASQPTHEERKIITDALCWNDFTCLALEWLRKAGWDSFKNKRNQR